MNRTQKRGQEFLEFVVKNEKRLKKNLMKNITYDENIFDDVFQDTILKVYETIVTKGDDCHIKDYEQYFFIASKFNYINRDNKEKRLKKLKVDIDEFMKYDDIEDETEIDVNTSKKISELREIVKERFGEESCDLYFDYMTMKSNGGMSYKEYSKLKNVSFDKVSRTVSSIKAFIRGNKMNKTISNEE